ncbi:MAG: DUF2569 domain-containing protein [Burkholderiaceae bacterium]
MEPHPNLTRAALGSAPASLELRGKPAPLEGIGGWLLLPALGIVISPIRVTIEMFSSMLPVLKPGVWQALTDPASDAYHPLLPPLIQFEAIANVLLVVLAVVTAICFFARKRSTPRVFIVFLLLSLAVQVVDWAWAAQLPAKFQADETGSWKEMAKAAVACAVWVPYFLMSKRVENTFTR